MHFFIHVTQNKKPRIMQGFFVSDEYLLSVEIAVGSYIAFFVYQQQVVDTWRQVTDVYRSCFFSWKFYFGSGAGAQPGR